MDLERNLNWVLLAIPKNCHSIFVCMDKDLFDKKIKQGLIPLHDDRDRADKTSVPCFIGYIPTTGTINKQKLSEVRGGKGMDDKKINDICEHYNLHLGKESIEDGEIEKVDFLIGSEADIEDLTANMAGFGTEHSQTVVIEYDKGYGYFLAKRFIKKRTSEDAPKSQ